MSPSLIVPETPHIQECCSQVHVRRTVLRPEALERQRCSTPRGSLLRKLVHGTEELVAQEAQETHLKHDDVARQLTLRDLDLACVQWACDSLRELTEEMEMWKWDDTLGNKWARVAMCSQKAFNEEHAQGLTMSTTKSLCNGMTGPQPCARWSPQET